MGQDWCWDRAERYQAEVDKLKKENKKLQTKLDVAVEALKVLSEPPKPMVFENDFCAIWTKQIAGEALKKLEG